MVRRKALTLAAIVLGASVMGVLAYFLSIGTNFDYSRVAIQRESDKQYISNGAIIEATDAALSDITIKTFFARYDNPEMHAQIRYMSVEEVYTLKYASDGMIRPEYAFLPDSAPVLSLTFYAESGIGLPEDPSPAVRVFLEPITYKVYKSLWV